MIEVMVSMLLTAIATAGIIALYVVETRASGFSRHTTEATVLAQDQLERLRTSSVTDMGMVSEGPLNEHGLAGGLFTRESTVASGAPGPNGGPDFDEILVEVKWTEDGVPKVVTLRSRRNR